MLFRSEMPLQPLPTQRPHPQPEGRQSSGACSSGDQRSDAGLMLGVRSAFHGLGDLGQATGPPLLLQKKEPDTDLSGLLQD